jgi:hypothetical protein
MDLDLLSEGQKPLDLPDEPLPRVIKQSVGNDRYFTPATLQISETFFISSYKTPIEIINAFEIVIN